MYGCSLDNRDSVVRYCSPSRYDREQNKIIPDAFELRINEDYLSCYWKEFYSKNNLKKIYKEAKEKLVIKGNGAFATLKIQEIKQIGSNNGIGNITVKHLAVLKSYSGIYNAINNFKFRRDLTLKAKINPIDAII